jgi:hypothetical protein
VAARRISLYGIVEANHNWLQLTLLSSKEPLAEGKARSDKGSEWERRTKRAEREGKGESAERFYPTRTCIHTHIPVYISMDMSIRTKNNCRNMEWNKR